MIKLETNRAATRSTRTQRRIFVPERNIDRFYKKYNFERQPEVACNGLYRKRPQWQDAF